MGIMRPALLSLALASCGSPPADDGTTATNGVTVALAPPEPYAEGNEVAANEMVPEVVENAVEATPPAAEKAEATPPPPDPEPPAAKAEDPPATATTAAAEPAPRPARLPLPEAEIARTIDRIGFDCGAVASAETVANPGGEPAYRINCTSGESYRGSTRGGRLFFRPWSARN